MTVFKATVPVSVMSRRFRRSFEKDERVWEAELEMVVDNFRKCFERAPEVEPTAPPSAPDPTE